MKSIIFAIALAAFAARASAATCVAESKDKKLAGAAEKKLYEEVRGGREGRLRSVGTTFPNDVSGEAHDRMPVRVQPQDHEPL